MKLLLVDDHADARASLAGFLEQLGHEVAEADRGERALVLCREQRPDLVVSDLRMPGMNGLELLQALEDLDQPPPLALMTAFGDTETAIEAVRLGAIDYLRKPIDVAELHRLVERVAAERAPVARPNEGATAVDGLVVAGTCLARLVALADRLHAAPDLPCLIEGETGVGKELFARRIHHGGRSVATKPPFVALNCAAIAPGLFEAELFGYVAGAFTGAASGGAEGKAALAGDGTLFLDEIGDLPLDQQAKLLRLLESRAFYPVGGGKELRLRARVVCATNARLLGQVKSGRFREDLFYRLKVGHLRIPPLRERPDEIVPLARALLADIRARRGRGFRELSSAAIATLTAHPWPGNVRQLRHVLEHACLMHDGAVLDASHLGELQTERTPAAGFPTLAPAPEPVLEPRTPPPAPVAAPGDPALALSPDMKLRLSSDGFDLDAWQRAVIAAALEANDGSPVRTAEYLRISRKVLYTLRKRYGLLDRRRDA